MAFKFFLAPIFLLGLATGSFLNCIIHRLGKEGFLFSRSYCPHCHHQLKWQDLIPILSFLLLKGRCRYCGQKISWQYPLVELSTAILFCLVFLKFFTADFSIIFYLIISCFLILIFVYDLKYYIIPDQVIYPAIAIAFFYRLFGILNLEFISNLKSLINPFASAFLALIFFLFIVLISKGKWMGVGDVKLAFFMGLVLGMPNILVALFLAFSVGAIIGISLIVFGKKNLKSEIPFGPFLVTGTFAAMLFGQQITNWYLSLLF